MEDQERRAPAQETIDNSVAIGRLTAISERTTIDVDKLVKNIEKILPIHEKISNLKKVVYSSIGVILFYGAWITQGYFDLKEQVNTHIEVQRKQEAISKKNDEDLLKATHKNENQVTYLKGAKLDKPKRVKG